jgi:hypothetical protein
VAGILLKAIETFSHIAMRKALILLDLEAIEVGKKTMKVVTTRMSIEDRATFEEYGRIVQYECNIRENMTFQEAIHQIAILLRESILPAMNKPTASHIATSNIGEIQLQTIPREILQQEIPQQATEPQPLQTASTEQIGYVSPSGLTIKKLLEITNKNSDTNDIAPSKQDNLIAFPNEIDKHPPIKKSVFGNGK